MTEPSRLAQAPGPLPNIPPLPEVISYYDDFSDSYEQIAKPSHSDQWRLSVDGRMVVLDFSDYSSLIRPLMKVWCADLLSTFAPVTTEYYFRRLTTVSLDQILELVTLRDCRSQVRLECMPRQCVA